MKVCVCMLYELWSLNSHISSLLRFQMKIQWGDRVLFINKPERGSLTFCVVAWNSKMKWLPFHFTCLLLSFLLILSILTILQLSVGFWERVKWIAPVMKVGSTFKSPFSDRFFCGISSQVLHYLLLFCPSPSLIDSRIRREDKRLNKKEITNNETLLHFFVQRREEVKRHKWSKVTGVDSLTHSRHIQTGGLRGRLQNWVWMQMLNCWTKRRK